MADEKHTAGPWSFKQAIAPVDGEYDYGISADFEGRPLCIAEAFGRIAREVRPNALANGRLIAAAPDLLEAAEAINSYFPSIVPSRGVIPNEKIAKLRAAIAKATGKK